MKTWRRSFCWPALVILTVALAGISGAAAPVEEKWMSKGFKQGRLAKDPIDTIVIHFSSNVGTNKQSPHDVDAVIKIFADYDSSAHYLIDRSGKVYGLVKETDTAQHAGKGVWNKRTNNLNRFSIGIEILAIGTADEMEKMIGMSKKDYGSIKKSDLGFTSAQYSALKTLIADIRSRHPDIKNDRQHIIGHDEYAPGRKVDPGSMFDWKKIGL